MSNSVDQRRSFSTTWETYPPATPPDYLGRCLANCRIAIMRLPSDCCNLVGEWEQEVGGTLRVLWELIRSTGVEQFATDHQPIRGSGVMQFITNLRSHFDPLDYHLRTFARHGVQLEGWFKGELLVALDVLVRAGAIQHIDREVKRPEGRIDLHLESCGSAHWIELKHWLIGDQRGTKYGPAFYFGDASSVGVTNDVRKLLQLPDGAQRWLLLLLTANPGADAWQRGVNSFNRKFAPLEVRSHTDPQEFPDYYYLGLLRVGTVTIPTAPISAIDRSPNA